MNRLVSVGVIVKFKSQASEESIQSALRTAIIKSLDTYNNYIAVPADIEVIFTGTIFEKMTYTPNMIMKVLETYSEAQQKEILMKAMDIMDALETFLGNWKIHSIALAMDLTYDEDKDLYY